MKQLLIALTSIVLFTSCKKDVAEGSGYSESPLLWFNGSAISEGQTYSLVGNDIQIKARIKLKTNCNIYCNVTLTDIGPNGNQTIGTVYSRPDISISFIPETSGGINVSFTAITPGDVNNLIKNNYYLLNLVFTGPDQSYRFQRTIRIKRN